MVKTAWERELTAFMLVDATVLEWNKYRKEGESYLCSGEANMQVTDLQDYITILWGHTLDQHHTGLRQVGCCRLDQHHTGLKYMTP